MVRFVVDTSGNVREIVTIDGPLGGRLRKEAIRIVAGSGKWIPAARGGKKVRVLKKIGIPFKI